MTTKAVQYYVMAGDAAYKLFANADAAAHYGRAVAVLNRDPASVASVPAETLKRLYVQRGRALELTQRFSDAIQNYQELRAWGEQQDAPELALAAQLSLAVVTSTTGPAYDSEMSRLAGQSALALARRLGDREAEARALWALFLRGWATGWGQEVIGYGEASLAIAQELALPEQIALTSGDLALAYLSVGALDKASAMLEGAIRFWRQLGNVVMLTNSLAVWSLLGINFAEYELLLERAGEVYELNERIGNIWGQGSGGFLRGVCYVEAAQYGMAIGSMEEIVELTRSGRLGMMEAICRGYLGWVYSHVGATEAALTEARAAHRLSESERGENNRWLTAILVMIFAEEGDLDMADRCLEACLAGFEPTNLSSPAPLFVMLAKARRHFVVKQYDQCLAESEALFALQARFKLENLRADALALKAEVLLVQGDHEAAAELLAQARAQAEAFGIRRILWRIMGLQAEAAAGRDEQPAGVRQTRSDGFRREAGELIEAIANDIDMPHHRESFLAQPAVRRILLPGRHD
jgi:tetratricopeptide (TPR) repeat protein